MLINITPCAMVARAAMRALRLHILTFFDFSERTELQNAEPGCQITRLLRNQKLEKLKNLTNLTCDFASSKPLTSDGGPVP